MTATVNDKTIDLEAIMPVSTELLVEGIPCTVRRLKAKEFFALLRVLTNGMGSGIERVNFGAGEDEMRGQFLGLFLAAVPNASEEFVDFLKLVVEPKDSKRQGDLNKAMANPELETVMDVLTVVAEQEAPDLQALLGKAQAALKKIQSVYQKQTGK
jgi:hypothetical protein